MIVGIDMGHTVSGPNTGAVGIISESKETRTVGNKVISLLKEEGVTVINCTVDSASSNDASLKSRVDKANAQSLDLFVSIHFNSGGGKGSEVYTYAGKKLPEASKILEGMVKIGFVNRGIKDGSGLYVIRNTKATSMLVEVCFVDTQSDVDLYEKNVENVAKAIVEGILGRELNIIDPGTGSEEEELELVDTIKTSACKENPIANQMIEEIKILQGIVGLSKDGVGTAKLCKLLPELNGTEQRGCVTVMQRILILKGMLSKGSDTGIIGPANKNAINRFKTEVGIPLEGTLVDFITWFKLIEY